jgi:transcription termination factor Rho
LPPPSAAPTYGDWPNPARFADVAMLDAEATQLDTSGGEPVALAELYALNAHELAQRLRQMGVGVEGSPGRRQLLVEFFRHAASAGRSLRDAGHLDQNDRGWFIVHGHVNYRLFPENTYLPESLVRRYGLKRGHRVEVSAQAPREGERCPSAIRVDRVMGLPPAEIAAITPFEELVPYYPLKRILLEARGGHPHPDRLRPARPDRGAATDRQDDFAAEHRQLDFGEQSGREADPPPDRRAPGGGDRLPPAHARRGGIVDL